MFKHNNGVFRLCCCKRAEVNGVCFCTACSSLSGLGLSVCTRACLWTKPCAFMLVRHLLYYHILLWSFFSATTAERVVEHKGGTPEFVGSWVFFLSLEFGVLGCSSWRRHSRSFILPSGWIAFVKKERKGEKKKKELCVSHLGESVEGKKHWKTCDL